MITEKQKLERKNSIGGSDVAALLNLSPWKSALDVYLDKIGEAPEIDEEKLPLRLYNGNYLEPWVAHSFEKETGLHVETYDGVNCSHETIRNIHAYPYSHVNVDGFVMDIERNLVKAAIEFKTSENKSLWEGDEIPRLYKPQLMHTRILTGVKKVYLAVCIGFNEFKYYTYEPTEKDLANEIKIQEVIKTFWTEHVEPRSPPTPRFYEDAAKLYPVSKLDTVKITSEPAIINAHMELLGTQTAIKAYKSKESALKATFGDYLKDDSELHDEAGKRMITWKTQESSRFDTTKFKKDHPEQYKEYLNTKTNRVMRVY